MLKKRPYFLRHVDDNQDSPGLSLPMKPTKRRHKAVGGCLDTFVPFPSTRLALRNSRYESRNSYLIKMRPRYRRSERWITPQYQGLARDGLSLFKGRIINAQNEILYPHSYGALAIPAKLFFLLMQQERRLRFFSSVVLVVSVGRSD